LIAVTRRECEKKIADKDAALDKREAELRAQQAAVKEAQESVDTLVAEKMRAERHVIASVTHRISCLCFLSYVIFGA
jgi:hypothetical protein